jgi:hypothetical protein
VENSVDSKPEQNAYLLMLLTLLGLNLLPSVQHANASAF